MDEKLLVKLVGRAAAADDASRRPWNAISRRLGHVWLCLAAWASIHPWRRISGFSNARLGKVMETGLGLDRRCFPLEKAHGVSGPGRLHYCVTPTTQ